jgi:hypothetical protein
MGSGVFDAVGDVGGAIVVAVGDSVGLGAPQDAKITASKKQMSIRRMSDIGPSRTENQFTEKIVRFCTMENNQRNPDEHQTHVRHYFDFHSNQPRRGWDR